MKNTLVLGFMMLFCMCFNHAKGQVAAGIGFGSLSYSGAGEGGVNLNVKYHLGTKTRIGANLGYYAGSDNFLGIITETTTAPITALFEYRFTDTKLSPYIGTDLGAYLLSSTIVGETSNSTAFGFAPVLGLDYNIGEKFLLNTNFKYHIISSAGAVVPSVGFTIGIGYKFSK